MTLIGSNHPIDSTWSNEQTVQPTKKEHPGKSCRIFSTTKKNRTVYWSVSIETNMAILYPQNWAKLKKNQRRDTRKWQREKKEQERSDKLFLKWNLKKIYWLQTWVTSLYSLIYFFSFFDFDFSFYIFWFFIFFCEVFEIYSGEKKQSSENSRPRAGNSCSVQVEKYKKKIKIHPHYPFFFFLFQKEKTFQNKKNEKFCVGIFISTFFVFLNSIFFFFLAVYLFLQ